MLMRPIEVDEAVLARRNELKNLLIKVNSILGVIKPSKEEQVSAEEKAKIYEEIWKESSDELAADVASLIGDVENKTKDLATRKSDLEIELASLEKYEKVVEKVRPLAKRLVALEGFETVALLIEQKYKAVLDIIRGELSKITKNQFEIVSADVDADTTAALIVFNKTYSEPVHTFLWAENVNEVRLPDEFQALSFEDALVSMRARRNIVPTELDDIKKQIQGVAHGWYAKLSVIREILQDRLDEVEVVSQFGQTEYTFVITGWMPSKYIKKSQKALKEDFGERVVLTELEVDPHELEEAPVMYENPSLFKPFETVMGLFGAPRYGTIDPTPFLAIFFPIFFGMIVGDIGYGLVILGLAIYLRWRFKENRFVQTAGYVLLSGGISALFFGFLYGEVFGNLPKMLDLIRPGHIPLVGLELPIDREKAIMPMLFVSVGVGAAHIVLGVILGFINAIKHKAKKHAIEKAGMFLFLFSIFLIVAVAVKVLPKGFMSPSFGLLMAGIVLLIWGGGFMGAMEIFGVMGNIFSYARIMALGLAGAILASVANKLVGSFPQIMLGIIIALLLHVINIVVGAFSPSIHALRLNFIEFFKQFYESGGKAYKPFKKAAGSSAAQGTKE
jgi:V/A-type H+-transporting ATPase subunit I